MSLFQFEEQDEVNGRYEAILLLIAATFVLTNALALSLVVERGVTWQHLFAPLIWVLVMGVAHFLLRRFKPGRDPFLLPIVGLLNGWGLLLIDRLAANFLGRQVMWVGLSTAVLLAVAILPPSLRLLRNYRYTWLTLGLGLLAATLLFGVNPSGFGARLWLPIFGLVYFQPSELLKLLLVVFLASYFDEREPLLRGSKRPLPYLAPLLLMWGFCMLLLIWQRDLGAATLFFIVFLALLYLATGEKKYVWGGLGLLLAASVFAYYAFDVVALRVDAWLNPWPDADNRAFQIVQSLYALAAGGVGGQGIAQGFPDYIPVVHSDFAFAAIAEEWGLVGSLGVVACFALLAYRGMRVAMLARRPFHQYLAAGITILFSGQTFLIMGGITRLLPLTGVTLPFVSYGGSSLLLSSVMAGLLLYLSAEANGEGRGARSEGREGRRVMGVILVGFVLVGVVLVYWGVGRAETILAREDNPRLVEAELRIERGQIVDRNGTVLANSVGESERLERVYPLVNSGPAVGYYSFRHGTAGVEEGFDAVLRGDTDSVTEQLRQELLHIPQSGRAVQLSLDIDWQQTADNLLPTSPSALVLLELDGNVAQIVAMVSHPNYDPNLLDEQFDVLTADEQAPLLNRVTQGQYQPGRLLQPFILAAAVEHGEIGMLETLEEAEAEVLVDGQMLGCLSEPTRPTTWAGVLQHACPAPMMALGDQLGRGGLDQLFADFGLTQPPQLPLTTETPPLLPLADPLLAAIGQDNLLVTPLQVALAWAALADDGGVPGVQLVTAVQDETGEWRRQVVEDVGETAISPSTAQLMRTHLTETNGVLEHAVLVLSGPEGETNAWYLGLAPADAPRYAVVIVVEGSKDLAAVAQMGRAVISER